ISAAGDYALVLELCDDRLHGLGGNIEGDSHRATRGREDRCIDANDVAVHVEGRATGIALVDRRINLDEVVVGTSADVAAAGRNDAGSHGAAKAKRTSDRDHPIANTRGLVRKLHAREVSA